MMKVPSIIRWAWIPGILLLGLAFWLWRGPRPALPAPEWTCDEANRLAAPALRDIRRNLPPPLPPPDDSGPAIRLRTATLRPGMDFGAPVHARPSARGYPWMVLFDGPLQPDWRAHLESAGATVRAYLPDHAWLVEAPAAIRDKLRGFPHVAWSGEYRPAHKIQPLLAGLARQNPDLPVPVTIQTFAPEDADGLATQLRAAGATDLRATAAKRWGLVRAVLPAQAATELASLPEVQWIEHRETPRVLNDLARGVEHLNLDAARDGRGLDGSGQIVAVADTGLDTGNVDTLHPDFAGRLIEVLDIGRLTNWSDTYYHGTHVVGSLLGTGAASGGQYRGAAPAAQLVFQSIMTAYSTLNLPNDLNELYQPPYDLGARVHSDSWGSAAAGQYTSDSMTSDEFIWDHPGWVVAFAAGNDGIDSDRNGVVDALSLDAPASAKNVLSVGASESERPAGGGGLTARAYASAWPADYGAMPIAGDLISSSPAGNPQGMAAFSSRGPAADGRAKPDFVAPGTDVVSARSRASDDDGWGVLAENTNYCFMGGTSMATPLAAGCATLVRQYCVDVLGMAEPSAALVKAALAGGARSLHPGQYGTNEFLEIPSAPRPNSVEGWGQIDVAGTLFPPEGVQAVLTEGPSALDTGGSNVVSFLVRSNAPLAVSLAYSDYPSALAAAVNLVNDLDLLLIDPNGVPHYPNGRTDPDALNNLEGIDVAAAATGRWTLVVSAPNVPQGPQPYALYLRGAVDMPAFIEHEPLETTWITDADYLVSAAVTSPGVLDPASVRLHWNTTGTGSFAAVGMVSASGHIFEASIPAQSVGTHVFYYLSAGPDGLTTFHPAGAPAELHSFDVNPPLALAVSGLPSNLFTADPAYGLHTLASNAVVHAVASYPPAGTNGWRTACVGWQGAGSVPPAGQTNVCDFTMIGPSIITWLWQEQVALMHMSAPSGAMAESTWHARNAVVSSLSAPESHLSNGVPLTFAGWQIDGARWPTNGGPSRRQIDGIPMPAPRTATAVYLATALDSDANGLPDWFEERYFGGLGQDPYGDPDGDGYENELEAADHSDPLDDASVPAVPVILHDPLASPAATPAPWAVSATITDNYQVATATLHWQRNGGLVRSAAMTNGGGDAFSAQIPSPARDGDQIVYWLSAADAAGFVAQSASWTVDVSYARINISPDALAASLPGDAQTNLYLFIQNVGSQPLDVTLEIAPLGFADDVESGTNGWTRPDGNADWHVSAPNAHSPSNAWYCGQALTQTYRDSTHAALSTPPIQLAADSPRLDFLHRARFEYDDSRSPDGYHYWDSGVLEITGNGGATWNALVPEGGYPGLITSNPASPFAPETPCFVDTSDWDPVGADLSAYAGREVQIRFRFGADAYVVAEGWRLDDVVVSPRTEYEGWLSFPITNWNIDVGFGFAAPVNLDTTPLPPMASGHYALLVHHNDPERSSPIAVPVALHNLTRRVRVTADGPGEVDPWGETLVEEGQNFRVDFEAHSGAFIADIRSNSVPIPFFNGFFTNFIIFWPPLSSNLDVHAVFAPILEDGLVPPEWLSLYGLTNRHWMAEASLDQDGDGFLTWQEYQLGYNPTNPADARLVVDFESRHPGTNDWRIVWHAFTNRAATYTILASTNPAWGGFISLTNLVAVPPVMTSPPLPPDHRYFGIRKE
ncbi:MAG: S8 family serine peptidase [Kiritimatiellia bacterium]